MSKKGQRNQDQQDGKLDKAYGGYLPSVEGQGRSDAGEPPAQWHHEQRSEKTLHKPD